MLQKKIDAYGDNALKKPWYRHGNIWGNAEGILLVDFLEDQKLPYSGKALPE